MSNVKYTKDVLAIVVAESVSYAGVLRRLELRQTGGSQANIKKRIKMFGLDTRHFLGRASNRGKEHRGGPGRKKASCVFVVRDKFAYPEKAEILRRALIESGRKYVCEMCGNPPTWNGRPLVLQVDHKNGKRWDCRKQNLRFACPNCHTQTETFGNKRRSLGGTAYAQR